MKLSLKYFFVFIILFTGAIHFGFGQISISNSKSTTEAIKSCQQAGEFTIVFENHGTIDASGISRRLTIPSGLAFSWINSSLPVGCTLSKGTGPNILDIVIDALTSSPVSINYTIEAGCNFAPASNQIINVEAVPNLVDNNSYSSMSGIYSFDVQQGSLATLEDVNTFQFVNGSQSSGWLFNGNTGSTFSRSYKVKNNSSTSIEFNGYLNFSDVFENTLEFDGLSIQYTDATGAIINTAADLVFPVSGKCTYSFKIDRLPALGEIIITENLKILACLDAGGRTDVSLSYGCFSGDVCGNANAIFNETINVSRLPGVPIISLNITPATNLPICDLGNGTTTGTYDKELTFTNTGTTVLNPSVEIQAEDPYYPLTSSTVVPFLTLSIIVNKKDGTKIVYSGDNLKNLTDLRFAHTISYPNIYYNYSKCYSGEVLYGATSFALPGIIENGESVTVKWTDIHCCPQAPGTTGGLDIHHPEEWRGARYQTTGVWLYYNQDCGTSGQTSLSYPSSAASSGQVDDLEQSFIWSQSINPYGLHLQGIDRTYATNHPGSPTINMSGDTKELSIKTVSVLENIRMNTSTSSVEIDIELEDGLTLLSSSINSSTQLYELGDHYAVTMENLGTILNCDISKTVIPTINNQAGDDGINEKWTFSFPLGQASLATFGTGIDLHERFINFISSAEIKFTVRAICSDANPSPNFYVSTFIRRGDQTECDCRLPITTINNHFIVTCPGCLTPGIVMHDIDVRRMNIGEIDNNNDGIADIFQNGTNLTDFTKRQYVTVGDTLRTTQSITVSNGVPTEGGYLYSDLLSKDTINNLDGIVLDNIYIRMPYLDGIDLYNSIFKVLSNGVELTLSNASNASWKRIGNEYIFHLTSTKAGLLNGFDPHDNIVVTLENKFIVHKNTGLNNPVAKNELLELTYLGILTDRDIDIFSITNFPTFENGSCNDRPVGYVCKDLLTEVKTYPNTRNFYCEPSNSSNFLYIPICQSYTSWIPTSNPSAYKELCDETISFRASYNHPSVNSFPNETRHYGNEVVFTYNLPPDYEVHDIQISNNVSVYIDNTRQYLTDGISLTPSDPRYNQFVKTFTGSGIKGTKMEITITMQALQSLAGSHDYIQWGDEDLALYTFISISPKVCGSNSQNYYYANGPTYIPSATNVYPFMDINFENFTFSSDLPSPIFKDGIDYLYRPFTNLALLPDGTINPTISGSQQCFSFNLKNNPLVKDPIVPGTSIQNPYDYQIAYTKNTYLLLDNLPNSFQVLKITRTNLDGSTTDLLPKSIETGVGTYKALFEAGDVLSGETTLPSYQVCGTYDCSSTLDSLPFKIFYGWNCGTIFPTISDILNDIVCYKKVQDYALSSQALSLVVTPKILPVVGEICNKFDLSINVASLGNGNINNYSVEVEVPNGLVPTVATIFGVPLNAPTVDPVNSNLYIWNGIYPGNLHLGEGFTFLLPLEIKCGYMDGSQIKTNVKAFNYCGSPISKAANVTPSADLPSSYFDNLSLSPINFTRSTATDVSISVDIHNGSSSSSTLNNDYFITLPAGLVFTDATILDGGTAMPFVPTSNINGVLMWDLPSISSLQNKTIKVNASIAGTVSCQNLDVVDAKIIGSAEISCYSETCSRTKELANDSGSVPCNICSLTVDAGPDQTLCRSQVGSIPLSATVGGSSNVSYLWSPGGETTQTINVSPTTTTTYTVTVTDNINSSCAASDNATITVNQGPLIDIRVDDPSTTDPNDPSLLCPDQTLDLIATAGYASYVWAQDGVPLSYSSTTSIISVSTAGYYTVTVTDGNGCSNTKGVKVVAKPKITGDGEMCEGQKPALYVDLLGAICNNCEMDILKVGDIFVGSDGYNYQKFRGAIPLAACTLSTDTVPVKVKPNPAKPIITPGFTLLCPNDPVSIPLTIPNIGAIANMTSYSWSTGVSGVNTITAKSAGRYTVTVLADGCTSEGYAEIVVPEIYLYQQCIDANNIILHAGYNMAGSGFVWTDGQGNVLTPTDPADPSRMTVSTGGVYTVTIINPVCGAITASISPSFVSPGANIGVNMVDNGDFANSITPAVYPAVQIPYQCPANPVISDLSCVNVPFSGYNQMVGNYTVTFMDAGNWNHGLWNGTGYIVTPGNPTERNFLLADGAVTTLTQRVWYTTVHNVTLGSRYHYRALVNNVINVEGQVPLVSLQIGAKTNMSKQTIYANQPRWVELSGEWIADVSGDVEIAVLLAPGGVIGRDIGVDEIAFEEIVCDASDYGRPCLAKVNVGPDKYVCPGLPIEIGANVVVAGSGLQYAWATSDAPAITFSTDANPIVNLSATTSYTLTVTDPLNNCKAIDNVTVHSITPNMVVTAMASPAAVCSDGITHLNATVAGTGNYAYTWSPAAGLTPSASVQNPTAVIRAKTIFTVTATDLIGCFASGNVTVDMANFNVSISPSMPVITCVPATISASGGVSWLWSDGSTTQSISTNNPGNYSVTATDANGCIATASVTIVVLPPAAPNITPGGPTTFCTGGSVTLTSNPGASYSWSDGSTTQSITVNTSGTYSVIITDQFGCLSTASISVTVNPLPGVPTVITPVTYCQNATATALLAGGSSLKWYSSPTGGTGSSTSPTPITTAAGTTNYYVSQTANNCEGARAVIAVIVNPLPSAPTVTSPVNYCQNATASALTAIGTNLKWYTAASGGTGSPTAPTPLTTTVGTTTYYVSQTVSGCESARASIDVIINAIPAAPVVTSPVTYCRNATAAPLTATGANLKWYTVASGGTGSSTALTPVTTASGTTIYYVSQTINGCESAKAQISVVVTSTVTPTPVVTTPVTYCQNDAASPLSATGSSLLWYTSASGGAGSSTAPTPVTTSAGTTLYYVSQTKNGCESARVLITVNVNPLPPATITASGSTNISNGGSVKLSVPTGTAYSYKWFNGTSKVGAASSYTATTAGNYTVEVTDGATGCKATSSVTTVTTSTGIHSLSAIDAFSKIYPNPVSKEITIETNLHLATASLKLLDAFGSEVSVSVSVNGTDAHVDVSFLPDGIYTLLITEDNYIIRKKIIVIH
jgi:hypothetical protein